MAANVKRKQGRPTKFKKEFCEQARKLCEKGFTNVELADFFEVDVDTIYEWKKVHSSFSESLKSGKGYSDEKVKRSLYERALGVTITETKEELSESGKKITTITKQIPGDTGSAIFWLKNRLPDEFRANPEPSKEHEGAEVHIHFTDAEKPSDD